ncbi:unnamed protein product, partial [Mesorhabditis belari]|uniref:Uncharacterized protein n=1 Tax=Mesorhabditis belari TaxID=2138241 RepID=A0AAF3FM07_9BILA
MKCCEGKVTRFAPELTADSSFSKGNQSSCRHGCSRSFVDSQRRFAAQLLSIMHQEEEQQKRHFSRQVSSSGSSDESSSSSKKSLIKKLSHIFKH